MTPDQDYKRGVRAAAYEVDDRGDRVQFYDTESGDIVGEINREAGQNANTSVWYGGYAVKTWAINNGYPEVAKMPCEAS